MVEAKAQEWLEENHPQNGTCTRENWNELVGIEEDKNYGKTRAQIIQPY
jgi:uncharacterized protein YmfQ (DUF2313 family)